MWRERGIRGMLRFRRRLKNGAVDPKHGTKKGQKFAFSYLGPPLQVRGLFILIKSPKMHNILYICACFTVCLKYIFPLQVKNKARDGDSEHAYILDSGLYGCEH